MINFLMSFASPHKHNDDYPGAWWACAEGLGSVSFISASEKGSLKFNGESFLSYLHHSPFSLLSFIRFPFVSPSGLFHKKKQ
jgi:hypothetical protein